MCMCVYSESMNYCGRQRTLAVRPIHPSGECTRNAHSVEPRPPSSLLLRRPSEGNRLQICNDTTTRHTSRTWRRTEQQYKIFRPNAIITKAGYNGLLRKQRTQMFSTNPLSEYNVFITFECRRTDRSALLY